MTQAPEAPARGHVAGDVMASISGPITVDQMRDRKKLITIEEAHQVLGRTEPMSFYPFETGPGVRFAIDHENWGNFDLAGAHGTALVPAAISLAVGGVESNETREHQLTKDAFTEAVKLGKMSDGFLAEAPGGLIEDCLNIFFRGGVLDKQLQVMAVGEDAHAAALVREAVRPFSNFTLLERAMNKINERYPGVDVFLDRTKLSHSTRSTLLQLVIPDLVRQMEDTGEEWDNWWGGLQIANSLAGEGQTLIEGFMFRVLCTNGMIDRSGTAAAWSRRGSGGNSAEDAYAWAEAQVEEVLGGLEHTFDRVQSLTEQNLQGEVNHAVRDVFDQYKIPKSARESILSQLVESNQLNMYAVTNAVTAAANDAESASAQQQLMRAGGDVTEHQERCTACHRLVS